MSLQRVAHEAVTLREFQGALSAATRHARISRYGKIGLAISGGVDSMALAYLWSQLKDDSRPFQALVVDHGVRPESKAEAQETCSRLDRLFSSSTRFVKSQLLTLEWPNGLLEARSYGFETKARALRYQALGLACRNQGIEALILGHHQDDRAETVLYRLARGHRRSGLSSIAIQAQIAECGGLFGIYESGSFVRPDDTHITATFGPETGGLTVHRPLLLFPKSRVIATCQAAGIQWVEDQSNHDPTFTERNAVRKLFNENLLPRALSRESLISFAKSIRSHWDQRQLYADMIYEMTRITLDLRSGLLIAQVPHLARVFEADWYLWSTKSKRRIAALYLRMLGRAVVSNGVLRLTSVEPLADTIFASDFTNDKERKNGHKAKDNATPRKSLAVSEPEVAKIIREAGTVIFQRNSAATSLHGENSLWYISRAPCSTENMPKPIHFPPNQSIDPGVTNKQDIVDTFKLWDGRFWMKIYNSGPQTVSVVMLRKKQRSVLGQILPRQDAKQLKQLLNDAAPGKIRYTLPAIAILPKLEACSEEDIENSQVIALPTLGFVVEEWKGKLTWDIRYKKLGLSGLHESIGGGGAKSNYKLEKAPTTVNDNSIS